jgi:hypothetical protein
VEANNYCPEPSEGEGDSDGEGDGVSSLVFFAGEAVGLLSLLDAAFFFDEVELVPLVDFLVPVELVDFLVVAVLECVVVVAVSSLCAQETTKAAPAITVISPRTNFFIVAVISG